MYLLVGFGYVGKAVHNAAALSSTPFKIIDPLYDFETWDTIDLTEIKGVVVCVSTPMNMATGACDYDNVLDVMYNLKDRKYTGPIMLKSTISVEGWEHIRAECPDLNLTFSPEFLTAANSFQDFLDQEFVVIGGDSTTFWADFYDQILPVTKPRKFVCSPVEAIMVKYTSNCFLSVKVSFFNQIFDLCDILGISFDTVRNIVTQRKEIGVNHTQVTEERGFGGACFPKDTMAMLSTSDLLDYDFSVLRKAVEYNDEIRMPD